MSLVCSVCSNPNRQSIDTALLASESIRVIAARFGLTTSSVQRHKVAHLSKRVIKALERKHNKPVDVFLDRHEHLYSEALQYIEDAKDAIKVQKTGAEEYTQFRDVGAMAPAITAAASLNRTLGEATGKFAAGQIAAQGTHIVILGGQIAIGTDAAHVPLEPEQPQQLDDGHTIDIKALGNS